MDLMEGTTSADGTRSWIRSYPDCVKTHGYPGGVPGKLCVHGVGDAAMHWTCCGSVDPNHLERFCPRQAPPRPAAARTAGGAGAGAWSELFDGHCLTFEPPQGNGLETNEGGRLEARRQDAFYLCKSAYLGQMLPGLLQALGSAPSSEYYVTGSQAMNHHLARRGAVPIPTDDIDAKFRPTPELPATLDKLMREWLQVVTEVLGRDNAAGFMSLGIVVLRVEFVPLPMRNWAGLVVHLADALDDKVTFQWNVGQVGDFDWDHWDVAAHTLLAEDLNVRFLSEEAVIGDLAVVWPRSAVGKKKRRELKGEYWKCVAGRAELPRCVGVRPPPPL